MNNSDNFEIDIKLILKELFIKKKYILLVTLFFGLCGIIRSYIIPVMYSSTTIFVPQNNENTSSQISGVASLIGINLGPSQSSTVISPYMYPEISNSPNFKRQLLDSKIDKNKELTLKRFIIDYYKIDKPEIAKMNSLYVSEIEDEIFEILNQLVSVDVKNKNGFIMISSKMPVAEYSSILSNNAREILQKIIIESRIESEKQHLTFTQNQLKLKRDEFKIIQSKLSEFKDSNLNLINSRNINKQQNLEAEFQIINSVVTELSKQVEQAKLQVSKNTPVFFTIKEAMIPNRRHSPVRTKIVLNFIFIGFISSSAFFIFKNPFVKFYKDITS